MKAGKVRRGVYAGMLAGGLMLPLFAVGADETSKQIEIRVTIDNPRPTCDVTVPSNVRLKNSLNRNGVDQEHDAFSINISCSGAVKNALTALAQGGGLQSDLIRLAVNMAASTSTTGPFLKLKPEGENRYLKLNGSETFCTNTQQNSTCRIIPVTQTNKGAPAGSGEAVVKFTIDYPA